MFDDLFASRDPLRHIDPRYEPLDPIFDLDEIELPQRIGRRKRRRREEASAEADPKRSTME